MIARLGVKRCGACPYLSGLPSGILRALQRTGAFSNRAYFIPENAAVLTLGSALPLMAQIENSIDFTASFPFYAGNEKMPAGSYQITQPDMNADHVLIQSKNGNSSAFVEFVPTFSEQPREKSGVTFQKYGDVDYLSRISIEGENYGMKVDLTKAEQKAESATAAVEHSSPGN